MSTEYPPPGPDPEQRPDQPPPPPPPPPPGQGYPQPGQPGFQGGAYGQGYGSPPPGYLPPGSRPKVAPMAIVSTVLGVVGFCCGQLFLVSIGAIVTGFVARRQVAEARGMLTGGPLAVVGIVLGVLGILLGIVYWVLIATGVLDPGSLTFTTS